VSDEAKKDESVITEVEAKLLWTCEIPTVSADKPWTVGQIHTLSCRGDFANQLKEPITIDIQAPKKN